MACDSFIRRHGLPDIRHVVWAIDGRARQQLRDKYWKQWVWRNVLRRELFAVVSMHLEQPAVTNWLIDSQPDDMDCQDRAMCESWLAAHTELQEKRRVSSRTPSPRPKQGLWQPPPEYALALCSTKRDKKLWRKCTARIRADAAREEDRQSRDNMEACLGWVTSHGYPSHNYCLVWAACGIATCTTHGEFTRFWAAHAESPERKIVYALGVSHGWDSVVTWRYGLATANVNARPPQAGYEDTWPEFFVSTG